MAYMSQERKREIAKELKSALSGSGLRYSLGVDNHSTLVMNIWEGSVDFIGERLLDRWCDETEPPAYLSVNPYHYERHFEGESLRLLKIIFPILNRGNYNKSDLMSDYHHVGWYVEVNVGRWNKPYTKR